MTTIHIAFACVACVLVLSENGTTISEPASSVITQNRTPFDHSGWDALLKKYMSADGFVDYRGLQSERAKLEKYLSALAEAEPANWLDNDLLAFLINAYNAYTIKSIFDHYPVASIKDIPAVFNGRRHRLAKALVTLNDIESRARDFGDPRVHFALNCASISCPRLQPAAFTGDSLETQLTRAARDFIADTLRGVRWDPQAKIIYLSQILRWYAADFANPGKKANLLQLGIGYLSTEKGLNYLKAHVFNQSEVALLDQLRPKVEFLPYDWRLNERPCP